MSATDQEPDASEDPVDPDDELKRKFREVLERKRQSQAGSGSGGAKGDSKIHGTHGPASHKRSFRRKSGG